MTETSNNRVFHQVFSLYASLAFSLALGIAVSVFNTRVLDAELYGDFKFIQGLWRFLIPFISGGIFIAGSKLLTQEEEHKVRQELIGTLILLCLTQGIFFGAFIYVISWTQEGIFNNLLGNELRFIAPLLAFVSFRPFMEQTLKGDNRVYSLGMFRVLPMAFYLGTAMLVVKFLPYGIRAALILSLLSLGAVIVGIIWNIAPVFRNIIAHARNIWQETKQFGFQVWFGSLFNNTTILLAPLCLAYFHDNLSVGFFSLAMTLAFPLRFIPASIGVTLFRKFAGEESILPSVAWVTIVTAVLSFICFLIILDWGFPIVYTDRYLPALPLCKILAGSAILQGIGGFYNNFLCARGFGKAARNASIAQGIANLLGFGTLVVFYGASGAALTLLLSGGIYFGMILVGYLRRGEASPA